MVFAWYSKYIAITTLPNILERKGGEAMAEIIGLVKITIITVTAILQIILVFISLICGD